MAARKKVFRQAKDMDGEEAKRILQGVQEAIWLRPGDEDGQDVWEPFADDLTSDEILSTVIDDLVKEGMRPSRKVKVRA